MKARNNWLGWVAYHVVTHRSDFQSKAEVARKLKVSPSTLTELFDPLGSRAPSFETLVASSDVVDMPIDSMINWDPPAAAASLDLGMILTRRRAKRRSK